MAIGSSFCGDEHDVRRGGVSRARNCHVARAGIFPSLDFDIILFWNPLLLAMLGAVAGILLMLPFNGMQTGTSNAVTFSEVVFSLQITWQVAAMYAIIFALAMGLFGGLFPAWHAARQNILTALRG